MRKIHGPPRAAWQIPWGSPIALGRLMTACWHRHGGLPQALHMHWCLMAEQSVRWRGASKPWMESLEDSCHIMHREEHGEVAEDLTMLPEPILLHVSSSWLALRWPFLVSNPWRCFPGLCKTWALAPPPSPTSQMRLFLFLLNVVIPSKLILLYTTTAIFPVTHREKKQVSSQRIKILFHPRQKGVGLLVSVPVPADG